MAEAIQAIAINTWEGLRPLTNQTTTNMIQITKEEAKVGDYVYVDGESSFCTGGYSKIKSFETRYNEKNGTPYEVVVTTNGVYRKDDGSTIEGATAYSIYGYYREDEDLIVSISTDLDDELDKLQDEVDREMY